MKRWKTAMCFLLAAALLTGCSQLGFGSGEKDSVSEGASSGVVVSAAAEKARAYKIGMLQFDEDPSSDMAREAFINRLEEWGYEDEAVEIDYQNAGGDRKKAESICKTFVEDETDMIVALSSPAAEVAMDFADEDTKVLFVGKKADSAAGENCTGISESVSSKQVIDLALKLDPELRTFGLLYDGTDEGAQEAAAEAEAYCAEKGLKVEETAVSEAAKLPQAAKDLFSKADALFTPTGGVVTLSAPEVLEAAKEAQKPWYGDSAALSQAGTLASVCADFEAIGRSGADMAVELMAGKTVEELPGVTVDEALTYVNQSTLEALGKTLPEDVAEDAYYFSDSATKTE